MTKVYVPNEYKELNYPVYAYISNYGVPITISPTGAFIISEFDEYIPIKNIEILRYLNHSNLQCTSGTIYSTNIGHTRSDIRDILSVAMDIREDSLRYLVEEVYPHLSGSRRDRMALKCQKVDIGLGDTSRYVKRTYAVTCHNFEDLSAYYSAVLANGAYKVIVKEIN